MEIMKIREGEAVVAVVTGKIDSTTAVAFERSLKEIGDTADKVVADFAGVSYVSSAGLRALLSVHKYMAKKGGLVIRKIGPPVMEVFEMTGFNGILAIQ